MPLFTTVGGCDEYLRWKRAAGYDGRRVGIHEVRMGVHDLLRKARTLRKHKGETQWA